MDPLDAHPMVSPLLQRTLRILLTSLKLRIPTAWKSVQLSVVMLWNAAVQSGGWQGGLGAWTGIVSMGGREGLIGGRRKHPHMVDQQQKQGFCLPRTLEHTK